MTKTIDLDELNDLSDSLSDGYDDGDVRYTCDCVQRLLGYDWVMVWEYFDQLGVGGSSEEFLRDSAGALYEIPTFLRELLFEGVPATQEKIDVEMSQLKPLQTGRHDFDNPSKLIDIDHANYVLQVTSGNGKHL